MGKPNELLVMKYGAEGFWTVAATADVLMRPAATLYSWIRRGRLKRVRRTGGSVFVHYESGAQLAKAGFPARKRLAGGAK